MYEVSVNMYMYADRYLFFPSYRHAKHIIISFSICSTIAVINACVSVFQSVKFVAIAKAMFAVAAVY